jgi:hypothetical protein
MSLILTRDLWCAVDRKKTHQYIPLTPSVSAVPPASIHTSRSLWHECAHIFLAKSNMSVVCQVDSLLFPRKKSQQVFASAHSQPPPLIPMQLNKRFGWAGKFGFRGVKKSPDVFKHYAICNGTALPVSHIGGIHLVESRVCDPERTLRVFIVASEMLTKRLSSAPNPLTTAFCCTQRQGIPYLHC